jgi:electron transfer flavoprotein beta subunit
MKILVLLKQTPDTEAKVSPKADGAGLDIAGTVIINPYDEFAVEEALKVKEKNGTGEVVIVSCGPADIKERMIKALAMGADRGIYIENTGLEDADSLTTAKLIAAAVKAENADLVFTGKQGIDADNMHVGIMVAELLGWPHVNVVNKFELEGKMARVEREVEGGQVEVYQVELPAVIGANKSLNTPRFASLPGIMKAKKKPLDVKKPSDLGFDLGQLKSEIKAHVVTYNKPPQKPAGKVFKGESVEDMVSKVVKLLREEAKVI